MRDLKFRAWDKKQRKMLYGVSIGTIKVWDENTPLISHEFSYSEDCMFEQYTGLKDKNGKEIYEGDILDDGEGHIGKVLYNERLASFAYEWGNCGSTFMGLYTSDMEVIGNIHENHELLEEQ